MAVLPIGMSGEAGGYQIERSLRFNSADSAYMSRTPPSAGNRKTWTWSGWVKLAKLSTNGLFSASNDQIRFEGDGKLTVYLNNVTGGYAQTAALYRDFSAWYHIVAVVDTTQATTSDRIKIYVNGQVQTIGASSFGSSKPIQNYDTAVNTAIEHNIGFTGGVYADQYLTDINFIDGQALTPSSFGETDSDTGVWKPKAYSGSYGTNGFYLKFADNSGTTSTTLGKDSSGNGNNWTPNNFSVTAGAGNDSLVDTPTPYGTDTGAGGQVRGNYATLNPLTKGTNLAVVNGNLDVSNTNADTTTWQSIVGTTGVTSGKWYFEVTINTQNNNGPIIGIGGTGFASTSIGGTDQYVGKTADSYGYFGANGQKFNNNSGTAYGNTYGASDVVGVAFDLDNGKIWFSKNGTFQASGDPVAGTNAAFTGLSGTFMPAYSVRGSDNSATLNFGQRPFAYTAPSGFKALCTQNLPTPTVVQGDDYFNTVLYTGNGSAPRTITGVGFQPDFVWVKSRSNTYAHFLWDAVRGTNLNLFSNLTNAEANVASGSTDGGVSTSASDGFTLTAGTGSSNNVNNNGSTYVAWNWKANGSGVSNTAGSITSTVSANTTAGFSVATFTTPGSGTATVGHGLGVAPKMIIVKSRANTGNWNVYHASLGATKYLELNTTSNAGTNSDIWANTEPTSSVFTVGVWFNTLGGNCVAYCFAPVSGFSAFGSYTGNGSADGPFVYTGFRPAFVMIKQSSAAGEHWVILDNDRNTSNVENKELYANLSNAESSNAGNATLDFVSNGFKIRTTNAGQNTSSATYIYACFAESPFRYSLAR